MLRGTRGWIPPSQHATRQHYSVKARVPFNEDVWRCGWVACLRAAVVQLGPGLKQTRDIQVKLVRTRQHVAGFSSRCVAALNPVRETV
jgi:hypothetical protein